MTIDPIREMRAGALLRAANRRNPTNPD